MKAINPEVGQKILAAKAALTKHLEFLPGAIGVFTDMLETAIFTGKHFNAAGLSQIFPTVPDEDIQTLVTALEAVVEERENILAEPTTT